VLRKEEKEFSRNGEVGGNGALRHSANRVRSLLWTERNQPKTQLQEKGLKGKGESKVISAKGKEGPCFNDGERGEKRAVQDNPKLDLPEGR